MTDMAEVPLADNCEHASDPEVSLKRADATSIADPDDDEDEDLRILTDAQCAGLDAKTVKNVYVETGSLGFARTFARALEVAENAPPSKGKLADERAVLKIRRATRKHKVNARVVADLLNYYFDNAPGTEMYSELSWEDRVKSGVEAKELTAEVNRQFDAKRVAGQPNLPVRRLRDMQNAPRSDLHYRVEGLLPINGRAMLAAQHKAGKTLMTTDLVCSLVDDVPFLGYFATHPVENLVLFDTEMDEEMLTDWLTQRGIVNIDAVHTVCLRNQPHLLNVMDGARRNRLAGQLREYQATVAILDCLSPVLDASGLAENTQGGLFLRGFAQLLQDAGIPEVIVTHHTGHAGGHLRGDSRFEAWPDATWRLDAKQGLHKPRTFSAFGRGVNVPTGRVTLDAGTLIYTPPGGQVASTSPKPLPDIDLVALAHNGGLTKKGAARALYGVEHPTPADAERAGRELTKLVGLGKLTRVDAGSGGGYNGSNVVRWFPTQTTAFPLHGSVS